MMKNSKSVIKHWTQKMTNRTGKATSGTKFASPVLRSGNEIQDEQSELFSTSHPQSNLRFSRPPILADENQWEREFREQSERVQLWNHEFWQKNNVRFQQVIFLMIYYSVVSYFITISVFLIYFVYQERKRFKASLDGQSVNNQEAYQEFYREFLNSNYENQISYNRYCKMFYYLMMNNLSFFLFFFMFRQWYMHNARLLIPAIKAKVARFVIVTRKRIQ